MYYWLYSARWASVLGGGQDTARAVLLELSHDDIDPAVAYLESSGKPDAHAPGPEAASILAMPVRMDPKGSACTKALHALVSQRVRQAPQNAD